MPQDSGPWQRTGWPPTRGVPALALAALLGLTSIGRAQQRFVLSEAGHWQAQAAVDPETPEGRLEQVRILLVQEKHGRAHKLASQWIEQYPNHPLLAEAYLLRGDSLVGRRHYFKALFDYEYIVRVYPDSAQFQTALEREYAIARLYAAGVKRRWLGLRILPAGEEAEELFIRIQERSPGSDLAENASADLGEFYFQRSQMASAAEAFELFLINYPRSHKRERAMLRLIQANLATFKGPRFDATGLIEAAQRLQTFQREFPAAAARLGASDLRLRIAESLALKDYYAASWYEKLNHRVSAAYTYERVARDRPDTVAAQAALRRMHALDQGLVVRPAAEPAPAEPGAPGTPAPERPAYLEDEP